MRIFRLPAGIDSANEVCDRCGIQKPKWHGVRQGWSWCHRHGPPVLCFCPDCFVLHLEEGCRLVPTVDTPEP